MKRTSILSYFLWIVISLSGQLAKGQNSSNTVKFTVTYNAATETYTAFVVPDYSVPSSNNSLSTEQGATAQFTLAVPRDFVITAITDVTGEWDKAPRKLGPGQPGQDWADYGLNPDLNYYAIGKLAVETNYGAFAVGQPVALFTFRGNGCFGPIQPLPAADPFISAANQAYRLNVGNSFYSRSGQPAGGNQEPLEQFIDVTGQPTTCLLANPDAASVGVGETITISVLDNDRNADGTPVIDLTKVTLPVVGSPAKGITTVNPDGTVNYIANPGTSGTDVFSYTICDLADSTVCSVTTVTITIIPSVMASPDAGTVSAGTGGVAVANVAANDIVNAELAVLGTGGNATVAAVGVYPPGITLDAATGSVSVAQGTTPGSYTVAYELCDTLTLPTCATARVTLTVTSSLTAVPDAVTVVGGFSVQIPILANDKNPDGSPVVDLTQITLPVLTGSPAQGVALVNADGTVSYTANLGGTGTDTFVYAICDRLNPDVCRSTTVTVTISPNRSVVLSPKVYLQGALFGVPGTDLLMRDDLRAKGFVPATSPYGLLGLNGLTPVGAVSSGVLSTTGGGAIVDWVFVELRSGSDLSVVIDSRSAVVQRSGDIVEVDGVSSLSFAVAESGNYYVGVRHRNHLGVLSAQAIPLSFTATVVDFRQPATATYNLNAGNPINQ
ncbi:MAG: Ig-like domain-containing protein, partial [Bacteroidetes bacterium]|nr:Ig-like domain-containing protein [Fibrella sp.]